MLNNICKNFRPNLPRFKIVNILILLKIASVLLILLYKRVDFLGNSSYYTFFDNTRYEVVDFQKITNQKCSPFRTNDENKKFSFNGSVYPKTLPFSKNESINFDCIRQLSNQTKKILLWNTYMGDEGFMYGLGLRDPLIKHRCPIDNCEITNDKSKLNESEFVLVHLRDRIDKIPKTRYKNQRWIAVIYESPENTPSLSKYNGIFNLTSTYQLDSDFTYDNFSPIKWELNSNFDINKNFLINKKKTAAAVISNCRSKYRLKYINELKRFIDVDVFGKCGKPCPSKYANGTSGDCKEIIAQEYKFYFSFENSICNDYITEKFFDILRYDIIPVVFGGGNYEHYV